MIRHNNHLAGDFHSLNHNHDSLLILRFHHRLFSWVVFRSWKRRRRSCTKRILRMIRGTSKLHWKIISRGSRFTECSQRQAGRQTEGWFSRPDCSLWDHATVIDISSSPHTIFSKVFILFRPGLAWRERWCSERESHTPVGNRSLPSHHRHESRNHTITPPTTGYWRPRRKMEHWVTSDSPSTVQDTS